MAETAPTYGYRWFLRKLLPERHGKACRIVQGVGCSGDILVEFEDGHRIVTRRLAIKVAKGRRQPLS